jgi:hypothetical protein
LKKALLSAFWQRQEPFPHIKKKKKTQLKERKEMLKRAYFAIIPRMFCKRDRQFGVKHLKTIGVLGEPACPRNSA